MKKLIFALLLMTNFAKTAELDLKIEAPFAELEQRVDMQLTDEFINKLRPFARNLDLRMQRLLENAAGFEKVQAEDYLVRSISRLVQEQKVKVSEMLSFEVLERALLIHNKIKGMTDGSKVGVIDMRIRILTRAIDMATSKYASADMRFFDKNSDIDYADFGYEYVEYLTTLNRSVFDADVQYYIERLAMKFFIYDLARSVNQEEHATEIVEIYDALPGFPEANEISKDQDAVKYIRGLRKLRRNVISRKTGENTTVSYSGSLYVDGIIQGEVYSFQGENHTQIYDQCIAFVDEKNLAQGTSSTQLDHIVTIVNSGEVHYDYNSGGYWQNKVNVCGFVAAHANKNKKVEGVRKYRDLHGFIKGVPFSFSGDNNREIFFQCFERLKSAKFGDGGFRVALNEEEEKEFTPTSSTGTYGACTALANLK